MLSDAIPLPAGHAVRQIAYFVADVREAAARHAGLFGSGPFFVIEHTPCVRCVHRGVERVFDQSIAIGQWGEVMVEFMQQHNPGPSVYRDLYPEGSGRWGLHHVALIAEDGDATARAFVAAGNEIACEYIPQPGLTVRFVDAVASYGHMIEIYEALPAITELYAMTAAAARDFDGSDPVRTLRVG